MCEIQKTKTSLLSKGENRHRKPSLKGGQKDTHWELDWKGGKHNDTKGTGHHIFLY